MNLQHATPRLEHSPAFLFTTLISIVSFLGCASPKFNAPVPEEERIAFTKDCIPDSNFPKSESYIDSSRTSLIPNDYIGDGAEPELVSFPNIKYPPQSLRNKQQGKVILWAFVCESGYVGQVKVAQSSGYQLLDSAAVEQAYASKYKPVIKNGLPFGMWVESKVEFRFDD